jgi:excisionase family DNA binding protein
VRSFDEEPAVATPDVLPPTISVEQAGKLLGVSRRAAYRAVHRGDIPSLHIGRRLLVPTAHLLDLLGLADKGQVKVDTRLLEALSEPQPA